MTLAAITRDLDAQWRRSVRRHQPTHRWAASDRAIPADPAEFTTRLADCFSPGGRDLLARIVALATDGDHDAALAATVMILKRTVRWEPGGDKRRVSSIYVEHDALAASVWEAVVSERRPERPFLRERLEQVAWAAVRRPAIRARRDHSGDAHGLSAEASATPGDAVEEPAATAVDLDALLDRLQSAGRLSETGRRIIDNIAAGGAGLRHNPHRGPRAAPTERLRVMRKLRDRQVHAALAG